jgi:hypothetical protein
MAIKFNLGFECTGINITAVTSKIISVDADDVDPMVILEEMPEEQLIEYVNRNKEPEDVFSETVLEKWAEANGYVKATDNE